MEYVHYLRNHTVPDTGLVPDITADDGSNATIYEIGDTREYLLSITLNDILVGKTKSSFGYEKLTIIQTDKSAINRRTKGLIDNRGE